MSCGWVWVWVLTMIMDNTEHYKVIAAEGEKKASGALREASEIISESPAALQLRYLQVGSTALWSSVRLI